MLSRLKRVFRGWRISPDVRWRWRRFREIKRAWFSFIILVLATFVSLFSNYIANHRAIIVYYDGEYFFPTYNYYDMATFGQEDDWGFDDIEADYARLQKDWAGAESDNWLILPWIPWDPYVSDFWYTENAAQPPPNPPDWDRRHYLGTDSQGRDVAARMLYGFRISMLFALALVAVSQIIGTAIGCLQGYLGGRFDIFSQRFIEIWSSLPFLYVVILMAALFKLNFWLLLLIMTLFRWISITYYMRTEMYREKELSYALAARANGATGARIIFRHLLPNCLTPLVTFTPFAIVSAIFALTSLDFLGYGLPAPTPSWGEMIDQALQPDNRDKLWLLFSPSAAISLTLILVTFVGEGVREAFDPKPFTRYEG